MSFEAPLGLSTSNHLYAIKVNILFISPFNPVWGRGFFLCSHHYFVTILRTISFVTDYFLEVSSEIRKSSNRIQCSALAGPL